MDGFKNLDLKKINFGALLFAAYVFSSLFLSENISILNKAITAIALGLGIVLLNTFFNRKAKESAQ